MRELREKYGNVPQAQLKGSKFFQSDVISADTQLTVRLVISYKRLKMKQIKGAFEESLGQGMQKLSGVPNDDLLHSFTKLFTDDIKLERGTVIDLTRNAGHVLTTTVGGKALGSVQSQLLCRALFDLYLGDTPFDPKAKAEVAEGLAALFSK